MRKLLLIFILSAQFLHTQDDIVIKNIFNTSLTKSKAYSWLDYLSNQIGGRLSGSLEAERAVEWGKVELEKLNFDKVWLQPVMVPRWVRGPKEFALIETNLCKFCTFVLPNSSFELGKTDSISQKIKLSFNFKFLGKSPKFSAFSKRVELSPNSF